MKAKELTELLGGCWHEEWRRGHLFDKECLTCGKNAVNRTFDTAEDIAFAIGVLKERGLLDVFEKFLWNRWLEWTPPKVEDVNHQMLAWWLTRSNDYKSDLILEFLREEAG